MVVFLKNTFDNYEAHKEYNIEGFCFKSPSLELQKREIWVILKFVNVAGFFFFKRKRQKEAKLFSLLAFRI